MSNSIEKLTAEERTKVNNTHGCREVLNGAKQLAKTRIFEIGDVLVAQNKSGGYYQLSGSNGNSPKKFVVVDKDEETGIVYAKGIIASGKLGVKIEVLATWDSSWTFNTDPDFAEAVLFDNEDGYDAFAAAKQLRKNKEKVKKANSKIRLDMDQYAKGIALAKTLKPGDKLWIAYGWTDKAEEYEITSSGVEPIDQRRSGWAGGGRMHDQEYYDLGLLEKPAIKAKKTTGYSWTGTIDRWQLTRLVYTQKPYSLDDVENLK